MLTRRAKAYSSCCSQTVSLSHRHFVTVHSWSVHCSQRWQKSIKKLLILEVQGLSKSSMLIRLKNSPWALVVIGSMPMPICNCFHGTLANDSKITTFTRVPLFDALEICIQCWKFHMQLVHVYLDWFQRNLLLKCVLQPEIAKKSI